MSLMLADPNVHHCYEQRILVMSGSNISITDILTLVQAYCEAHETADDHLQAAVWNLTKARRSSRLAALPSTEYTATNIRNELNARARVANPEAVFRIVDPKEIEAEGTDKNTIPTTSFGLRNRKGNVADKPSNSMMVEESTTASCEEEEPLLLLAGSLPPRELRIAQEQARQSLDSYIQAATLIAALQQRLSKE